MMKYHQPQVMEQIEVIKGVVLLGISKMNDSSPNTKPKEQTQFSSKKTLVKENGFDVSCYICYHTSWWIVL